MSPQEHAERLEFDAALMRAVAMILRGRVDGIVSVRVTPVRIDGLDEGELAVLRLLASGKRLKEISETLGIGRNALNQRLALAKVVLGCRTLPQLVAEACQRGIG